MSLSSTQFILFVILSAVLYYTVFKKIQWQWLLVVSYVYYIASGYKNIVFILGTTVITYLSACLIQRINDNNSDRSSAQKKLVLIMALLLDFGILAVLKYTNFVIFNINEFLRGNLSFVTLILPLGISFYTFQSTGYLLDVYWKKAKAERNFFKLSLFVSYFPQIMQGPINRFNSLSNELFKKHIFEIKRTEKAVQLILYGLFKKMILADNAAMYVNTIFGRYDKFDGMVIVGVLAYSIQLYGDFSGGIDIVRGVSYIFGVEMSENFKQPYFATSITDFWHRWHITLGNWMKDYVFYPVTLSRWMNKFQKWAKKVFGKKLGRTLPICISNIIVFMLVGVWHGADWKYIVYGLYNGIIIGFSGLMAENYKKGKKKLHINDKSNVYHVFMIVRTFILVNISWLFDRADTVDQAKIMFKNMLTKFDISPLFNGEIFFDTPQFINFRHIQFAGILIGCIVVFVISFMKERKIDVGEKLVNSHILIRGAVYLAVLFILPMLGMPPNQSGGFIYAQF